MGAAFQITKIHAVIMNNDVRKEVRNVELGTKLKNVVQQIGI